jgi:hypothetical protein
MKELDDKTGCWFQSAYATAARIFVLSSSR